MTPLKNQKNGRKRPSRVGLPPGTLVHTGKRHVQNVTFSIVDYDESSFQEHTFDNVDETFQFMDRPTLSWLRVTGVHDVKFIESLGTHLKLHPLILEDIVDIAQRPKMEDYGTHLFFVTKALMFDTKECKLESEQISIILGPDFVATFQERASGLFDPVMERLKADKGRLRKGGPDYLAYALLDVIVDNYFVVLENIGDSIEDVEEALMNRPDHTILEQIHGLKREVILLRKSIWPLRDVVGALERGDSTLMKGENRVFLRDLHDHIVQVIETVESYRDLLSSMSDLYLSSVSNRLNEVMKVLTIITTIFIPLTLISGIYGMNFVHMPELQNRYAYPLVLTTMVVLASTMLLAFRRKGWL